MEFVKSIVVLLIIVLFCAVVLAESDNEKLRQELRKFIHEGDCIVYKSDEIIKDGKKYRLIGSAIGWVPLTEIIRLSTKKGLYKWSFLK